MSNLQAALVIHPSVWHALPEYLADDVLQTFDGMVVVFTTRSLGLLCFTVSVSWMER